MSGVQSPSVLSKHSGEMPIPLTVKQIDKALLSNDDKMNLLIDGVHVNKVRLVGMILNKAESSSFSFWLDDGTGGRVECIRWVHHPVDTKEMESIVEGMYVRVHGLLKGFRVKKQLLVIDIKPVTDFDEITHHFVECIYVHSSNTKLMVIFHNFAKQQASSSNQTHMPSSAANTQTYQTIPSNQFTGQHVADGPNGILQMVLDYLKLPSSLVMEGGVHYKELATKLGIPLDSIMDTLASLVDEGLVYHTTDDWHFKFTTYA
ncbi:hypothetical protein SSX86_002291 [Deinandra increscens subsp. villosa]|uniref:Replication protein A 32 kDa subunit n=1 Tax=Deinandra increscens subsp. villosa TaxID=3103831 RepID=A0AAP0DW37_9ASTR